MELWAQGHPLAKITAEIGVSKTTRINWDRGVTEEIDNLRAIELEAMYDKYDLSTRKKVEFFWATFSAGFYVAPASASAVAGATERSRRSSYRDGTEPLERRALHLFNLFYNILYIFLDICYEAGHWIERLPRVNQLR